jgi:hypothetical protein
LNGQGCPLGAKRLASNVPRHGYFAGNQRLGHEVLTVTPAEMRLSEDRQT